MQKGENLLYLAKKEQCLALSTQLRPYLKLVIIKFTEFFQIVKFNTFTLKTVYSQKN